jgi:uncharacterized membrane protein YphA (DoxX/SURF4 family)
VSVFLWILQILLAVAFGVAGATKVTQPKHKLAGQMGWVEDFSDQSVKYIGTLEILGAIGLILPWAFNIAAVLTPIAALGLAAIMVGAMVVHGRRGEYQVLIANAVLAALAVVVAVGRF